MVDVNLNWLKFLFFFFVLLVILIDCLIFLSPFLDVTRISMSTVSFLAQLDSEFSFSRMLFLTYDPNGFKCRVSIHLLPVGSF